MPAFSGSRRISHRIRNLIRFAGRLEVVADGFDRFFEKLILVETFGPGRIFSQRIRFKNQHIGCGHAKVGLLRP